MIEANDESGRSMHGVPSANIAGDHEPKSDVH